MDDLGSVELVYADRELDPDAKVFGRRDPVLKVTEVNADRLADSVARLSRTMDQVFDRIRSTNGPYELESFEVSAEFTGSGEVRLIGSVGLEVTGGVRLTFKKKDSSTTP
ncbi:hypothetical protein GCM10009789_08620 [Kribbella sancticallisti]|uniref:Pepco domain-containing protein n=1 Tax=Kribbella sancticallisti TaxID=460087 RepID=A0ABN2CH07_9ACTN